MLTKLDAVILAGGLGTRLRSVVQDRPKVLAEIAGRPFLTYLLDQLIYAGISKVVLCTGYRSNQVRDVLGDEYRGLGITYSIEAFPLGTAGALRLALPLLRADTALVINGDSYCDADFASFLHWHENRQAMVSLLLTKVDDTQRFGRVQVAENGTVTTFHEKGIFSGPGLISAGVYLISRNLLVSIAGGTAASLEREVFPRGVGHGLYGFETESLFIDIGTPDAFASAESFFSNEVCQLPGNNGLQCKRCGHSFDVHDVNDNYERNCLECGDCYDFEF